MARCVFNSELDCRQKPVHGVNPCLTCIENRRNGLRQLALGVFC